MKWVSISFLMYSLILPLFGQIKIYPISGDLSSKNMRIETDTFYVKLPFFDDFSNYTGTPKLALWKQQGGTRVNHSYTDVAPSLNIVTFDGTDENGYPYNFVEPRTVGLGDQLASQHIDLSEKKTTDDIFISFYWQTEGLGEAPDSVDGDFLKLEFLNKDGKWIEQWITYGQINKDFQYVILPINKSEFLHTDFQFRFRSSNRLSGAYDTWNIDYIYIDENRDQDHKFIVDIAITNHPTSYLKHYRSMPINQFYANQKEETAKRITAIASNLHNKFNVIQYKMILKESITGDTLGILKDTSSLIDAEAKYLLFATTPQTLPQNREKMVLTYDFILNTGNLNPISGVNLKANDTVSEKTILSNYYAYDDGTAEYGVGIQQRFGKLAYEFNLNESDVLTHIDLMFVRLGEDLTGETFNLYIWKKLDTEGGADADSTLLVQNVIIKYPKKPDALTRIKLSRALPLSGKFYIGFEQLNEKDLTLGFDRSTNSMDKAYYNVANQWEQNPNLKGSIMLRPVFDDQLTTAIEEKYPSSPCSIYPNPNHGVLQLEGNVKMVRILDLTGKLILQKSLEEYSGKKEVRLPKHIPNGMYIVELSSRKHRVHQKCILIR